MTPTEYARDTLTALQAKEQAQWIAFAPFVFQATHALRATGLLAAVEAAGEAGVTQAALAAASGLSAYGVRVLIEAGLAIGLVTEHGERYRATKVAHYLLHDAMTQANFDFTRAVNYEGLARLETAVRTGAPAGLRVFGDWPTIYDGLAELPADVREPWFRFVHLYSDLAFPAALRAIFRRRPRRVLDIGGNTGKFAIACARHDPDVAVTIVDLPGQLRDAARAVQDAGLSGRIAFHEANVLDAGSALPGGCDGIWMSQFLYCFSEEQIVAILRRAAGALAPGGRVYILEPMWDRQRFRLASFCLQMTSLYFTALANGNSQMYRSDVFLALIRAAGFVVEEQLDELGVSQTLLVCRTA